MRRFLATLSMLLAVSVPCQAQGDKAKPNTLTPKEIADGWILLFDGATTFGLSTDGTVTVADGTLVLQAGARLWPSVRFGNYEMDFEYSGAGHQLVISPDKFSKKNFKGAGSGGGLFKASSGDDIFALKEWERRRLKFQIIPDKGETMLSTQRPVDGVRVNYEDWEFPQHMQVWFAAQDVKGRQLGLRNIKLRPLKVRSNFNGKDLTGWREFPGKKSRVTVTDKGELNIQDGPGDLQTVGKYQNFILQLECISNGKHLNSGIFFRCRDNEYQNGYEAQIRNQFTAEATQEYLIEEFDPKTNNLIEKKKIKSTAVDYGTGAIYRRQPARKEMSKDGEWFGMTIVANGNHLATWVNGVQVTDWHDHRRKSDNARTGCKLEAGHISIQGHDPTTNLSFRDLRIVELPKSD